MRLRHALNAIRERVDACRPDVSLSRWLGSTRAWRLRPWFVIHVMRKATPRRRSAPSGGQGSLFGDEPPAERAKPPPPTAAEIVCCIPGCGGDGCYGYGPPRYFYPMRWFCVTHNPTTDQLREMLR